MGTLKLQEWVRVGVLLLLSFILFSGTSMDIADPPAHYYDAVQELFSRNLWEDGKRQLDRGLKSYPKESNLQMLAGKYYLHYEEYDRARYHLVKSLDDNYNNVDAKQMLVKVEEATGNYSSAVCYVNELLEVQPYWRGLWRKKIELYNKQGNKVEANRLFKRLQQIYPNDAEIKHDYFYALEEDFVGYRNSGDAQAAAAALEEMVRVNPQATEYQLALINHYLRQGYVTRAIDLAGEALVHNPGNVALIDKKVGMLTETGRLTEAMALVEESMRQQGNSVSLQRMYDNLLMESARQGRRQDPYVLYGMIYERDPRNEEALQYLLNTSITRGYDQDALHYLAEAKKFYGENDKSILFKEYEFNMRMGRAKQAYAILSRLNEAYPDDYDVSLAMCEVRMAAAAEYMDRSHYREALPEVKAVAERNIDPELTQAALMRQFECCVQVNDAEGAEEALIALHAYLPYEKLMGRQAMLLNMQDRPEEALALYTNALNSLNDSTSELYRAELQMGYEELAIPYIKRCMQDGAYRKAFAASTDLVAYNPENYLGLLYSINAAGALQDYDSFDYYTNLALTAYPDDLAFMVKKSTMLDRAGNSEEALALLRTRIADFRGDPDLVSAFSASSELEALRLSRENRPEEAIALIDTALVYDANNKSLKYTKGLIFEKAGVNDSAAYYYQFYEPGYMEMASHKYHINVLKNKTYKNEIVAEYLQSRYSEKDVISGVATISYTRKEGKNSYTGTVNYAGRNGDFFNADGETTFTSEVDDGGTGLQIIGAWDHSLNSKKQLTGRATLGWGHLYFPKLLAGYSVGTYIKDYSVEAGVNYRLLADKKSLFNVTLGANKVVGDFNLGLQGVGTLLSSKLYFNVAARARYYPMGIGAGRTSLGAIASIGTAPELAIIDYYSLSGSFSHLNTMVGLYGRYLLTDNVSVGLMGQWWTLYDQKLLINPESGLTSIATQYRNLYNVLLRVSVSF